MNGQNEQNEQNESNVNNAIESNVNNVEQQQQPTTMATKLRWVDADASFFPFLKNGYHYFKVESIKDSNTWETESGKQSTLTWYRCKPIDEDNLEICKDKGLYPIFRSYIEIEKGAEVICKRSEGIYQVFPIDVH